MVSVDLPCHGTYLLGSGGLSRCGGGGREGPPWGLSGCHEGYVGFCAYVLMCLCAHLGENIERVVKLSRRKWDASATV